MDNMDEISFGVEFTKIDKANRTVTGIATANNVDLEGDVISPEASSIAFAKWVGNLREMHKPDAVGKAVSFRPVPVPYRGKMYDGLELEAYVSRGAQDTWEKVLDGTLRGFSIGGKPKKMRKEFNKSTGQTTRIIEEYDLFEVSLVDNPCNPAAMISLVKRAPDGSFTSELDMKKYQIYYCAIDGTAFVDKDVCEKGHTCSAIGQVDEIDLDIITKMISNEQSGSKTINGSPSHAETSDNSLVKNVDASIGGNKLQENTTNDNVNNVSDLPNDKVGLFRKFLDLFDGGIEEGTSELVKSVEPTSTTPVINIYTSTTEKLEKAADAGCEHDSLEKGDTCSTCGDKMTKSIDEEVQEVIEEEGEETMDLEKFMGDISALLDDKLTKVKEEITTDVNTLVDEKIETIQKSVDEKVEAVEGRVETVESAGALKKSVDEEDEGDEVIEKSAESFWNGTFVNLELVKVLGYDS